MNDLLTLQALCTLLMSDDPSVLSKESREALEKFADKESREFGFDNWIDAYHNACVECGGSQSAVAEASEKSDGVSSILKQSDLG